MLKISTLRGQIAIGILLSLPIPVIIDWDYDGTRTLINAFNLVIQLVGLCVLFGIIKNGKGSEFKVTRILIAMFLWGAFWLRLHSPLLEQAYWFDRFLPKVVLYASYNAMVIAMVVLFSYVIGKWINSKIVKEETLFSKSTLKGQIAICSLLFLPIPVMIMLPYVIKYFLTFLIPFVVFCVLFWIKNSKGAEFKVTRIILATLLWSAFCLESFGHNKYRRILEWLGLDNTGYLLGEVLYASYNAVGIAMAVIFSYVIGKWINGKIVKNGDQINEERE